MVCAGAPASDQRRKTYVCPSPGICGEIAEMSRLKLTTPVMVLGDVKGRPSITSCRSGRGELAMVTSLLRGKMFTEVVLLTAPADDSGRPVSVTVRRTSYQMLGEISPVSAGRKEPAERF